MDQLPLPTPASRFQPFVDAAKEQVRTLSALREDDEEAREDIAEAVHGIAMRSLEHAGFLLNPGDARYARILSLLIITLRRAQTLLETRGAGAHYVQNIGEAVEDLGAYVLPPATPRDGIPDSPE